VRSTDVETDRLAVTVRAGLLGAGIDVSVGSTIDFARPRSRRARNGVGVTLVGDPLVRRPDDFAPTTALRSVLDNRDWWRRTRRAARIAPSRRDAGSRRRNRAPRRPSVRSLEPGRDAAIVDFATYTDDEFAPDAG
jgi:hypothetical protein